MQNNFRKLRIGFDTLIIGLMPKEYVDTAIGFANSIKEYFEKELDVEIIESGDIVASMEEAKASWKLFKSKDVDAVILFNGTFSPGNLTVEIVRNIEVPFLLWGVEEYEIHKHDMTGSMVALFPQANTFANFNRKFSFIYGSDIKKQSVRDQARVFVNAVRAIAYLREATIGVMGMRPDGFEITDYDELALKEKFGTTIKKVSMYEFTETIKNIPEKEIDEDMKIQKQIFEISNDSVEESRGLSRVYLAVEKVVKEKGLNAYAPDCWPELREKDKTPICAANGRMNEIGIMASCECDVDGSLALMMEYAMTKSTPWLADLVNYIEKKDALLFFHCGNASASLCKSKPVLERPFGGLAPTGILKNGIATVCSLNSIRGKYMIHVGVGEVIDNEEYVKGSNLTIRMNNGSFDFIKSLISNGVPHHNSIVYGDISPEIKEFANLMNIPIVEF